MTKEPVFWLSILAQNRDFCLPHLLPTPPLGGFPSQYCHIVLYRKIRMAWLPDSEIVKIVWRYVYSFWQNSRTWRTQTDRQTNSAWRHRPRLCIASRGKKRKVVLSFSQCASGRRRKANKNSCAIYQMVPFPMTLNEPKHCFQGHTTLWR